MVKVLFVCLGNICRSPTAHGVFRHKVKVAGLADKIEVDSAGTAAWHIGKAPDSRSQKVAAQHGYELSDLRARQVSPEDFERFDYILAMDKSNYADLLSLCSDKHRAKIHLFLDFLDDDVSEVPDPYYGASKGFEDVLMLVEQASEALLSHIVKAQGLHS